MDKLGSLYGFENPMASGFLDSGKHRNDAMKYSDNESSCMLRVGKGVKVEFKLLLF